MKLHTFQTLLVMAIGGGATRVGAQEPQPLAWWRMEPGEKGAVVDGASGRKDAASGNLKFVDGVRGQALKLDDKAIERGPALRIGHRQRLEGADLVMWIEGEWTDKVRLTARRVR